MYLSTRHLTDENFNAFCYIYVASMGLKKNNYKIMACLLYCNLYGVTIVLFSICYVGIWLEHFSKSMHKMPTKPFFYRIVYVYLEYHFSFHKMFLFSTKHNLTSEFIKYTTTKVENLLYINLNVLELVVTESFLSLNLFKVL